MPFEAKFVRPWFTRSIWEIPAARHNATVHEIQRISRHWPRGRGRTVLDENLVRGHIEMAVEQANTKYWRDVILFEEITVFLSTQVAAPESSSSSCSPNFSFKDTLRDTLIEVLDRLT